MPISLQTKITLKTTTFLAVIFAFFLILIANGGQLDRIPSEQPGCAYCPHAESFYEVYEERNKDYRDNNWVCEESFENKLKICVSMFKTITSRKLNSTYELIKDKESVDKECKEQSVTFFEPVRNESELSDPSEVTIGVPMFRCPITKIHLQFPLSHAFPVPVHLIKDFYITKGKFDQRPIIAVLQNSTSTNNICLKDIWIFDYTKIIPNYTQTWR